MQQRGKFYRNLNTTDQKYFAEYKSVLQCPTLLIKLFSNWALNWTQLNLMKLLGSISSILEENQTKLKKIMIGSSIA